MNERQYQFEWDEAQAAANLLKHGISFELDQPFSLTLDCLQQADLVHSASEERWFSIGLASDGKVLSIAYLWSESGGQSPADRHESPSYLCPPSDLDRDFTVRDEPMSNQLTDDDAMPSEVDFSHGVRGLHHLPPKAKIFLPASIERTVWLYFYAKAQKNGVDRCDLLTDILKA